jgi:hypothetical protein
LVYELSLVFGGFSVGSLDLYGEKLALLCEAKYIAGADKAVSVETLFAFIFGTKGTRVVAPTQVPLGLEVLEDRLLGVLF